MSRVNTVYAVLGGAVAAIFGVNAASAADELVVKAKPVPAIESPFFTVNDNRLSYSYQFQGTDAGYYTKLPDGSFDGKTTYQTIGISHFDVWQYGTNTAVVNFSKANHNDPAAPCTNTGTARSNSTGAVVATDCSGAASAFGSFRSTFGFNEISHSKMFSFGPLRDVSFVAGGDIGLQDAYFASNTRRLVTGLQFAFDLPYKGYFNIQPLFDSEWNHNAFAECGSGFLTVTNGACNPDGNVSYKPTWMLETSYYMNLDFLPPAAQYFAISGRLTLIGPKGPEKGLDIPNAHQLTTEIISEPIRLTFDAGGYFGGKRWAHELDVWGAWRYGKNQYGDNVDSSPACITGGVSNGSCEYSTLVLGATARF